MRTLKENSETTLSTFICTLQNPQEKRERERERERAIKLAKVKDEKRTLKAGKEKG